MGLGRKKKIYIIYIKIEFLTTKHRGELVSAGPMTNLADVQEEKGHKS